MNCPKFILASMPQVIIFLIFCCPLNIKSFEVKVLLQKGPLSELEKNPIVVQSDHGFICSTHPALSVGSSYDQKTISIDYYNKTLLVQNKSESTPCYISPALSLKHREFLQKMVTLWGDKNSDFLHEECERLHSFFDTFIDKKSEINNSSYQSLNLYMHDIFTSFLSDIVERLETQGSVLSLQTLESYVHSFLQKGIKERFLNQLAVQQVSKKDKKSLQQDVQFRQDFLSKQVRIVVLQLLQEFVLVLPRNFLSQIVQDEVGCLHVNGISYLGSLVVLQENNMIYLINSVDIDDYLLSVIHHEGWPGWPLEMNKVLAITCRTYLVWQVLQAKKSKRPYHIENGIRHQSYKGHHRFAHLKQAIRETRDVCIGYENDPILAMFDACCGGVIPAHIDHPDYQKHPYLLRTNKCAFCKDFKVANWKTTFSHDEMVERLKKAFPNLTAIDSMTVTKKDNAFLATDVSIFTQPAVLHVTGKKMYSLFPEVRSFCFDVDTLPKKVVSKHNKSKFSKAKKSVLANHEKQFVISGRGYGHHIGLCQWGAMKLARDHHWNYQKILQFYYPGTNLIKLTYQR